MGDLKIWGFKVLKKACRPFTCNPLCRFSCTLFILPEILHQLGVPAALPFQKSSFCSRPDVAKSLGLCWSIQHLDTQQDTWHSVKTG